MLDKGLIAGLSFFSDISPDKLGKIAEIAAVSDIRENEIVFSENDAAENFYGVLDGEIELYLTVRDKILKADVQFEESVIMRMEVMEKPVVVDTVAAKEIFGWSSLVPPGRWTATARCVKSGRIVVIPAAKLKGILEGDPQLGYLLMTRLNGIISGRLQKRTDKLVGAWIEAFGVENV